MTQHELTQAIKDGIVAAFRELIRPTVDLSREDAAVRQLKQEVLDAERHLPHDSNPNP